MADNLDLSDLKTIDIPENELSKCSVKRGDVLFNRTNSRELVGKTCVYNRDELMVLAGYIIRVSVNEMLYCQYFIVLYKCRSLKNKLFDMAKGD